MKTRFPSKALLIHLRASPKLFCYSDSWPPLVERLTSDASRRKVCRPLLFSLFPIIKGKKTFEKLDDYDETDRRRLKAVVLCHSARLTQRNLLATRKKMNKGLIKEKVL